MAKHRPFSRPELRLYFGRERANSGKRVLSGMNFLKLVNSGRLRGSLVSGLVVSLALLVFAPNYSKVALAASFSATNAPAIAGQSVSFSGDGFKPGETLSAWTTDPTGFAYARPSLVADSAGHVSYSLDTLGYITGQWALTVHGLSSGLEAIAPFQLVSGQPTTIYNPVPDPNTGPVPQGGMEASPDRGYIGQTFLFSGDGFTAHELIHIWETNPTGGTIAFQEIYADGDGKIINYAYQGHGPLAGIWAVTFHGMTSGVEKTGFIRLLNKVEDLASVQVNPDHGNNLTYFEVDGANFFANEPYSYWFTAPDGTVWPGRQGYTASDGTVSFHNFIPDAKPGRWSISVKGDTSSRIGVGYFNYDS